MEQEAGLGSVIMYNRSVMKDDCIPDTSDAIFKGTLFQVARSVAGK